jgi:hypothetical protein
MKNFLWLLFIALCPIGLIVLAAASFERVALLLYFVGMNLPMMISFYGIDGVCVVAVGLYLAVFLTVWFKKMKQ